MFFFTTVGRINGPWVNLEPKKKSFNQALGAPVKASRPAKPIHCVVVFITWTNNPFFIGRTCTGWATNRICVLFSTCFGLPRTLCHVPPISNRRSSPSSTTASRPRPLVPLRPTTTPTVRHRFDCSLPLCAILPSPRPPHRSTPPPCCSNALPSVPIVGLDHRRYRPYRMKNSTNHRTVYTRSDL